MGRYTGDSGLFTYAEYKNRGVIKMAPDALVFISSNMGTTVVAPVKGATQKVDFRDGISSISVQNVVDPPGASTASIEIIAPLQDSNYWITFQGDNGKLYKYPYFAPMMEVKIFFRGRFMVNDTPRYYPAFWGFITNVDENYSGGVYKFSLTCADMLHWWSYMQVLFKPDVQSQNISNAKQLNVLGSTFGRANAFEIIYNLVQQTGYESFTVPTYLTTITPTDKQIDGPALQSIWKGMRAYWSKRFSTQANLLRMYGARGNLVNNINAQPVPNGPSSHADEKAYDDAQLSASAALPVKNFDAEDSFTQGFPVFFLFESMGISQAEYLSKLEIATQVKTKIEYEFFQDVNGNFIFKPPFYNLNTKNILPYRIKPIDIINYSFGTNSDEIVTALEVQTGLAEGFSGENAAVNNIGYHMDLDLTERYGERFQRISLQYLTDSNLTQSCALGHLSKMNLNAYFGSVTIPGRPEMKLGYPVYIEHKDKFYYVASINHSFDYAGSFTTTLSLKGERPRIYDLDKNSNSNWVIQKNKIYIWKRVGTNDPNITSNQVQKTSDSDPNYINEQLRRGANYIKSVKVGDYDIVDLSQANQATVQENSVPYTDEEGYKVIGSFRYGRGIVLKSGVAVDGSEIQLSNLTIGTPDDFYASTQAENITNMKTASELEGAAMSDYFTVNKSKNIETVIPEYMAEIPMDPKAYAEKIANMSVSNVEAGIGELSTPLTARSTLSTEAISKYVSQKQQGIAPGGITGFWGSQEKRAANCAKYDNQIQGSISSYPGYGVLKPELQLTVNDVKAIMMQESGGKADAMSSFYITTGNRQDGDPEVGGIGHAYGLMQIRPGTADDVAKKLGTTLNIQTNPADNIRAGAAYLQQLKIYYKGDMSKVIPAYNAGPGNVNKYDGTPPFKETLNYVPRVESNKEYLDAKDKQAKNATPAPPPEQKK